MHNARNGDDIAIFLAEPVKEDIEAHLANLRCSVEKTIVIANLHFLSLRICQSLLPVYFKNPVLMISRICKESSNCY